MGKYYLRRGNYRDAVVAFEAAEKWYVSKYGPEHYNVVASLIQQGWCNAQLSRREAACRAYRCALQIIEATEGPHHPKAREIQQYLASNCTGRLSSAAMGSG
jgi:tetratricopeptide (TPR) repeat protein